MFANGKGSGESALMLFECIVDLFAPILMNHAAHGKIYNKTCATIEDTDQPAHPRGLISPC